MESKKGFLLYPNYKEQIDLLSVEEKAELLDAIFDYQNGIEVGELSGITRMAFSFIKSQFDRDNEAWENTKQARSEAGKKGGAPKGNSNAKKQPKQAKGCFVNEEQPKQPKQAVNVNVNVNDNVNVNEYICARSEDPVVNEQAYGEHKNVILTDQIYNALVEEHGVKVTTLAIQAVDDYCKKTGKVYQDYYLAIRDWGIDAAKESLEKGKRGARGRPKNINFEERDVDYSKYEKVLYGEGATA